MVEMVVVSVVVKLGSVASVPVIAVSTNITVSKQKLKQTGLTK